MKPFYKRIPIIILLISLLTKRQKMIQMTNLEGLNCIRCGSIEQPLTTHEVKKTFMFIGGRRFGYFVPESHNSFNFPVCLDCKNKMEKFKKIFMILRIISIIWIAVLVGLFILNRILFLGIIDIAFFGFFILLDIIIFLLASDLRTKNMAKIGLNDFMPFIRPNNSNKWVMLPYWIQFRKANLTYESSSIKEYNKQLSTIAWALPYIGGTLCLFATIIPFNFLAINGMWSIFPSLITYYMFITDPSLIFGNIFFLIVLYISSYLVLKNANQLKKSKILIKGVDIYILVNSVILLLTAFYFLYIYSFGAINVYFILIGSISSILGYIFQKVM